jgi:ABC-2 type transport system ATP-binding protein
VLADGTADRAAGVLEQFGRRLPQRDGAVLVELVEGAIGVAPVVRALDEAGLAVESLDLVEPTLDDVFVAKTGYHLEGSETPEDESANPEPSA